MSSISSILTDHLALVIVISAAVLVLLVLLGYFCWRKRYRGYQQLEMGLEDFLEEQKIQELKNNEHDRAEIHCRFFLRGVSNYTFTRALPYIGSRKGKFHFLVKDTKQPKKDIRDQLISMFPRDENCCFPFTETTKGVIKGLLSRVQHPFVWPTILSDIDLNNQTVFVFQPYRSQGSLKDQIYKTEPDYPYIQKYHVAGKPLTERAVAVFGRQILEGLRYFERMEYPYGQLKTANIIIDGGNCRLAGYENTIFGFSPPLAGSLFVSILNQHRKRNKNRKLLNILQFGHVIFEMATGYELETAVMDHTPKISKKLTEALEFIFGKREIPGRSEEEKQCPFPTVKELMEYPFFDEVVTTIKKTDLAFEPPQFDQEMKEILESIKNQKKLQEKKSQRKVSKSVKRRAGTEISQTQPLSQSPSQSSPQRKGSLIQSTTTTTSASKTSTATTATATTTTSAITISTSVPPPPPPLPSSLPTPTSESEPGRGALLSSITGFSSTKLKKVKTVDKSKPLLK